MATTKAISGNATKPYIGKIFNGGNIGNTTLFGNITLRESALDSDIMKTLPAVTSTAGAAKPYSSGTFGYQAKNQYVVRGMSGSISGVSTSLLRIPGSDYYRHPLATSVGYRRIHITSWSYVTGAATKGGNAGDAVQFHDIGANNDTLANEPYPSRSVPAELVYRTGAFLPKQDEYNVKVDG